MKFPNIFEKGFRPHYVLKLCFLGAVLLSFFMALRSDFNRHPDEVHHFKAARYYYSHFFPPQIEDPAILDSYSAYGVSYLNYQWVEYFVSGHIALVYSLFITNDVLAVRLSIITMFLTLAVWFLYRSRENPEEFIIPSLLLISSQVWYVFSYSNNDAFVLFIAVLTAYQLAYPQSLLNQFLSSDSFTKKIAGGLWTGFLLGLILICKPNYYPFLIFAALWVLYQHGLRNFTQFKKYALMMLIAVSILGFRCGLDIYSNGETNYVGISYITKFFGKLEKQGKLLEYQEKIASYDCKPSTLINDPANSHPDLNLMAKGTPLTKMLFEMKWFGYSLTSFVGGYGYMNIWSSKNYYAQISVVFILFFGYLIYAFIRSRDRIALSEFGITFFCCFLTIAISIALSWIYAFQPQGRYLFPVLPMLGVLLYSNRQHLNNVVMNLLLLTLFLFSAYAFTTIALVKINAPLYY